MQKLRSALYLLALLLLVPLLVLARRALPQDGRPLVEEKYAGWSGVLRLWVVEGWTPGAGSVSGWLNQCISGYEKRHPGVYVQPEYVDAGAIATIGESGILPPDLLLFPPGQLESPASLFPIRTPDALRPELSRVGQWEGSSYAVPVAMGGYLWAYNTALTKNIPGSWRDSGIFPAVPEDDADHIWSAAMLALCAAQSGSDATSSGEAAGEAPGIDLGLEGAANAPTPAARSEGVRACRLPVNFQFTPDAWRAFMNGESPAMPVTQREIRRLQALSDRGKGPDWALEAGDALFSDQLLCAGIVNKPNAQRELCQAWIDHMLDKDSQGAIHRAGAFSVTTAGSGYDAGDPLALMDESLRSGGLCAPSCFGTEWKRSAVQIVREFVEDSAEAPVLWRKLADKLVQ